MRPSLERQEELESMRKVAEKMFTTVVVPRMIRDELRNMFGAKAPALSTVIVWKRQWRLRKGQSVGSRRDRDHTTKSVRLPRISSSACIPVDWDTFERQKKLIDHNTDCRRDGLPGYCSVQACLEWQIRWRLKDMPYAHLRACDECSNVIQPIETLKRFERKFGRKLKDESDDLC